MEPTGPFGPFEITRELDSGGGATVYKARKEGDAKGEYVLKVFAAERLVSEEAHQEASELDPLFRDLGASFTNRVNLQKAAAESSSYFAPILAAGHDERGAWYATNFYARSIRGMLERFVALEAPDVFQIVQSVVKAALHLKRTAGRPHGNLRTSNIFIEGLRKPRSSPVLVADPMAGGGEEARAFEKADLRAIGELLYQLVLKRKVDFTWVMVPVDASADWTRLFGKQTAGWLELCNRLLDPGLSLDNDSLERVEEDLRKLKPKASAALTLVPAVAAALLLGGIGVFFLWQWTTYGKLVVTTEPPGARVKVAPKGEGEELTGTTPPAPGKPVEFKLVKGDYTVSVSYAGLGTLSDVPVRIGAHQTIRTNLGLAFGGLVVVSDPAGAEFQLGTNTLQTPYTNLYARPRPQPFEIQLRRAGYETTNLDVRIGSNRTVLVLSAALQKPPPGNGLVDITSDPPGAEILLDGVPFGKAPLSKSAPAEVHTVLARLAPFEEQTSVIGVKANQTAPLHIYFPHGSLTVTNTDPPELQIRIGGQLVGLSPTNLSLRPGSYQLEYRSEGFETNTETVLVLDGASTNRSPRLAAVGGLVELLTDPPGAEVANSAGIVVAKSVPAAGLRISLRPGVTNLVAKYGALDPVWSRDIQIKPGRVTNAVFKFQYGKLAFTSPQAEELGAEAMLKGADGTSVKFGQPVYQRPDASVAYRLELADYEPWTSSLAVKQGQALSIPVKLQRRKVKVVLNSNLRGDVVAYACVDESGHEGELGKGTDFQVPWGSYTVIARAGNLDPLRQKVEVPRSGGDKIVKFEFTDYGSVVTTNLDDGTEIHQSRNGTSVFLGRARDTFYSRPGPNTFQLVRTGFTNEFSTNVLRLGWVVLPSLVPPPHIALSGSLVLVWVQGLPGTPGGGYVGECEVKQGDYQKVLGSNPSSPVSNGPWQEYPVNTLGPDDAQKFCDQLTAQDASLQSGGLRGFRYTLPTVQQWQFFAARTATQGAVLSKSLAERRNSPERVGLGARNPMGLFDVVGNVWEICRSSNPGVYQILGGGYELSQGIARTFAFNPQTFTRPLPQVGFRLVLVPTDIQQAKAGP